MPRPLRVKYPGAIYHVMSRGNRKSIIFHDDDDRRFFLTTMARVALLYDVLIDATCLMNNHYHLILETPRANVSDAIRDLNGIFARRSNRKYGQTGHVFGDRYRALLIQSESYLKRAARYVVRNPVRAALVKEATDWPWSSYRSSAGLASPPAWLHTDWIEVVFPAGSPLESRHQFREYVNAPAQRKARLNLMNLALGDARFKARICKLARRPEPDRPLRRSITQCPRPALAELFEGCEQSRWRRDGLIYTARVTHGYRLAEIARFLKIDPSTASKAASRMAAPVDQ
jgi:putative transposase